MPKQGMRGDPTACVPSKVARFPSFLFDRGWSPLCIHLFHLFALGLLFGIWIALTYFIGSFVTWSIVAQCDTLSMRYFVVSGKHWHGPSQLGCALLLNAVLCYLGMHCSLISSFVTWVRDLNISEFIGRLGRGSGPFLLGEPFCCSA